MSSFCANSECGTLEINLIASNGKSNILSFTYEENRFYVHFTNLGLEQLKDFISKIDVENIEKEEVLFLSTEMLTFKIFENEGLKILGIARCWEKDDLDDWREGDYAVLNPYTYTDESSMQIDLSTQAYLVEFLNECQETALNTINNYVSNASLFKYKMKPKYSFSEGKHFLSPFLPNAMCLSTPFLISVISEVHSYYGLNNDDLESVFHLLFDVSDKNEYTIGELWRKDFSFYTEWKQKFGESIDTATLWNSNLETSIENHSEIKWLKIEESIISTTTFNFKKEVPIKILTNFEMDWHSGGFENKSYAKLLVTASVDGFYELKFDSPLATLNEQIHKIISSYH